MRIVCRRSALMGRTSGLGAMAMVDLPMAEARARLSGREDRLSVAVSNSPRSCVVSGEPVALREWMGLLERDGVFCRLVKVDVASHSPQMDGPAADLSAELAGMQVNAASVPLFSTVLAQEVQGGELGAAYWGRNLREPVRFAETMAALMDLGATSFVELGPHPVLAPALQQTAQARAQDACVLTWGRREEPEVSHALEVVAGLWAAGHEIDWSRLIPASAQWPELPLYPWQRERHWVRQAMARDAGRPSVAPGVPDDQAAWLNALRWVSSPLAESAGNAAASTPSGAPWLVVCAGDAVAAAVVHALHAAGVRAADCKPQALAEALAQSGPAAVVMCLDDQPGAAHRLVAAMQAISRAPACAETKLWAVTTGAQEVLEQARHRVAVHAAAAWGAGRVLADEHAPHWGGMVDLDPEAEGDASARQLARQLLAADGEPQVAWRQGRRFVLRLSSKADTASAAFAPPWRADGAYTVTGGLGDVGLRVAAAMVSAGVRRPVLMGRHGLPPRQRWRDADLDVRTAARVAAVRSLESAGAAVHVIEADPANAHDTERALREYEAAAWPPIRGVVHAAGVLESQLALQADAASFERVLAPKLEGALILDRLLPRLDCFILFSSIIAVLGVAGTAAYAAANAGLDALAADRRARGSRA
ncbi:KR domain-containing protein [Piscinibacter aquaticus]|uniref:KR domain-containing protein n=1 Tax=Piscinibacter aquaticus TaxID=392597 RepID=A0A5C6U063_9BURK|nr:KR domain-containing protein [Piscinibacter aquaticus]